MKSHDQEKRPKRHELTSPPLPLLLPLRRQHALRIPRQRHPLPRPGPHGRRRPALPHRQEGLQRTPVQYSSTKPEFFIACIILGLEDLQKNNIIHRDIKPENLVLDSRGYIRITDLGIARIHKTNNSCDTSGTPGYMCTLPFRQLPKSSAE